ncbi:MAG TPA: hypothetical protein VK543_16800 [Puia sp.]|nr:hypothetical protein [Puia sp.]
MTAINVQIARHGIGNRVIRFFAHAFSIIFHPLFITTYVIGFLIYVHPFAYSGIENNTKFFRFLSVFFTTLFLPLFSVFIAWRLGLVQSIQLRTNRDRIIPYVIVMIFYFWVWYVYNNQENPPISVHFLLGSFLAICGAWMCNIYYKVSMHAVAVGGLSMFFLLFSFHDPYASGLYLSIAILITGIVCTSRLIVSDHTPFDIYSGLLVGILAQWIAWQF